MHFGTKSYSRETPSSRFISLLDCLFTFVASIGLLMCMGHSKAETAINRYARCVKKAFFWPMPALLYSPPKSVLLLLSKDNSQGSATGRLLITAPWCVYPRFHSQGYRKRLKSVRERLQNHPNPSFQSIHSEEKKSVQDRQQKDVNDCDTDSAWKYGICYYKMYSLKKIDRNFNQMSKH